MSVFIRRHGDSTKKYLFKNGLCSGIAWSTQAAHNGTAEVSSVIHVGGYSIDVLVGNGSACISAPIDLTRFSKLKVHINEDEANETPPFYGFAKIKVGTSLYGSESKTQEISFDASDTVISVDIASLNGSYYVCIEAGGNGYEVGVALNRFIKADKVWLEV